MTTFFAIKSKWRTRGKFAGGIFRVGNYRRRVWVIVLHPAGSGENEVKNYIGEEKGRVIRAP